MDTKFKNENKLSKKVCVLIVIAIIFIVSGMIGIYEQRNAYNYKLNLANDNEFNSGIVNSEAVRYVKNLNRFYIYFKDFDSKKAYSQMQILKEMINSKSNTNENDNKTISNETLIENDMSQNYNENNVYEEAEEVQVEPEEFYFEKEPEEYYGFKEDDCRNMPKEKLIKMYQDLKSVYDNYEEIKEYLKKTKSFQYKIENKYINKVYTNNENIDNEEFYAKFGIDDSMFAEKFNGQLLSTSFENNGISGYIIIPKNMGDISNDIYINIKTGELADKIYQYLNYIIPGLFMIAFAIIMYILLKQKSSAYEIVKRCYRKYKKIPICCKIILLFFAIEYFNENHSLDIWYDYYAMQMNNIVGDIIRFLIYFLVFTVFFISVFFSIIYIINMILKPSELKNEYEIKIIYDISRDTKYILNTRNYSLFVLYMFLIAGTAVSIFLFIMVLRYLGYFNLIDLCGIIILEFSGLIIVYKIMKLILSYCKLSYCMENMVKGNVENISEKSKAFKKPFEDLQKINDDIKEKIEEMMKNERLKTELITNVSHDLKTPLTSVINYIDLLKEEKIDNDSAKDYIHIIDDKAQRLKNLIDDLFEASKLSAKQFKLDIAKSDVIALLKQTLGEINHKIEKSDINFVIELPNKPIYLNIDGQQIWRVFNNLLNNIIKYSPQNSRAYISLEENESDVKIIMKNVSKVPLNFNANELFERFKRGDKARSTEGSGLGLSIAKSIIELHGGEINVQIDGDLFKAVVVLRKNINDDQN